jgi:hypothetical protein
METEKSQSPKPNSDITKHDFLIDPQRNDEKTPFFISKSDETKRNQKEHTRCQDGKMNHNHLWWHLRANA